MSYYLVHVKVNPKLAFPRNAEESEQRLQDFLKTSFNGNAWISNDFGVGDMEEFHAMTIYVDKEIDNQETLELIKDWLNAQDPSNTSWFDEDENPLACGADDERSPELNDAIRSHYGALNIF